MTSAAVRAAGAITALGLLAVAHVADARAAGLPKRVGSCDDTTIVRAGPRLDGAPESGSGVAYADGGSQVSYSVIPGLTRSRRGDPVRLCLVSIPRGCPKGDERGRVYRATNLRTGETWTAPDSSHLCGGA